MKQMRANKEAEAAEWRRKHAKGGKLGFFGNLVSIIVDLVSYAHFEVQTLTVFFWSELETAARTRSQRRLGWRTAKELVRAGAGTLHAGLLGGPKVLARKRRCTASGRKGGSRATDQGDEVEHLGVSSCQIVP